jgi:hypothetical protein
VPNNFISTDIYTIFVSTKKQNMKYDINKKFEFLSSMVSMVVNKITPSLIITGEGGLGKTFSVKKVIHESGISENEYVFFKGYSTARGLYNVLYENNGKIIIFDDCDSVLEDKNSLNILKSALDSYDVREISWMSSSRASDSYPNKFVFDGFIIFISNKKREKIDNAILSRSLVIDLSMSPDEKIKRMRGVAEKVLPDFSDSVRNDVLNFLDKNKENYNINMRTLIMVAKMRKFHPSNWGELAEFMMVD